MQREKPATKYKTAVERPILKPGLPNFRRSFYFILLLIAYLLLRRSFYDVTFDTFQCLELCHPKEKKKFNMKHGFVIAMWKYLAKIRETTFIFKNSRKKSTKPIF